MIENCSSPHKTVIDVSGIKLSRELVQFNCLKTGEEIVPGSGFFRLLAEHRINIPFLCTGTIKGGKISFCCVEAECFEPVNKLLEQNPHIRQEIEIIANVGTLTLYPHRCNLNLVGLIMSELGKAGIPIYGMATSISALTFSTDYPVLNRVVDILGRALNLPSNHAPFRAQFRVKQI